MRGCRFGFNASCFSPFTRSAISDDSRALSRRASLFSSVAYVLLSLTPQPVFQTGRKPDTTGRLFGGQPDLPRFSGEGTRQRSESAGWASPPTQSLGRVPGWEGAGCGWAQRSVCGAVCYWPCLERLRQWSSGPSAESTKTTAEPPRSAASARRAPRWTWSRPSWVPSRACGQYSSS